MISNRIISLHPESAERIDAVNTIKYTLLLDYTCPEIYNKETLIEDIIEYCRTCCSGLYESKPSPRHIKYNFFGRPGLENQYGLLQHLDYESFFKNNKTFEQYSSLSDMILQHCVLSSYHALITDLFSEQTLTSYSLANIVKKDGLQALKGKNWQLENEQLITKSKSHNTQKRQSSLASDFNKLFNTRLTTAPGIFDFCKSGDKFYFATSGFSAQIKELKISLIRALFGKPVHQSLLEPVLPLNLQSFSAYNPIITELYNLTRYNNVVDMIYQKYLTERVFDLNLFYSLLNIILFTEDNSQYQLNSKEILDTLALCQKLPNTFSRQLFVKYATDHIFSGSKLEYTSSYNDFWFEHDPKQEYLYTNIHTLKTPNIFSFPKWLEQYQLFIKYMADFVIPVYEWCFINMLLETIEHKYPDKTHTFHLYHAIELLSSYMSQNYKRLLTPIVFKPSKEANEFFSDSERKEKITKTSVKKFSNELLPQDLCISKKMNWVYFTRTKHIYDRSNNIFKILFHNFYSIGIEKELNLTLLNPSYFKEIHKAGVQNSISPSANIDYLRNCYIDLLRYDRLT